jgi:hypothetical protein
MQELRLVAVSEDGSYAVLVAPGRSGRFALPIDERLRTVARGQFSRLAQYEIEVESPLRPKEIQDRIRAGETAEDIADAAGLPVDRIRRFEGPVLAEREFRAQEAQRATVRGQGDSGPGPRLGEVVAERLAAAGASVDEVEWDSRKRQDGNWQVQLAYTVAGRLQLAEWVFDPRSRHVTADDEQAARLSLPEADWPAPRPGARGQATATVTPISSRAGSAGYHHGEQRPDTDRAAGRGVLHPSRQVPAAGAATSPAAASQAAMSPAGSAAGPAVGLGAGQPAGRAGQTRPAENATTASQALPKAAAGREGRRGQAAADLAAQDLAAQDLAAQVRSDPAAPAEEPEPAAPPARRASGGRSRRSSVPSWDEIMLGNSRQPD